MSVFYAKFDGHYPVGACAVVVAPNAIAAAAMLQALLSMQGLHQDIEPSQMMPVGVDTPAVYIILDGDY